MKMPNTTNRLPITSNTAHCTQSVPARVSEDSAAAYRLQGVGKTAVEIDEVAFKFGL